MLLLFALAAALAPAPDYPAELGARLAAEVRAVAETDSEAAIALAARIETDVGALTAVRYEAALVRNRAGLIRPAIEAYTRVLELDPDHVGALYDRGELRLIAQSDDPTARARAKADLQRAAELRPDHWAVHYRLAVLAAQEGEADVMESALLTALTHGMAPSLLLQDPAWRPFLVAEPAASRLRRLLRTHGSSDENTQLDSILKEYPQ